MFNNWKKQFNYAIDLAVFNADIAAHYKKQVDAVRELCAMIWDDDFTAEEYRELVLRVLEEGKC